MTTDVKRFVMRLITEPRQLVVGKSYWVKEKNFELKTYIVNCEEDLGHRYLGPHKIWATEDNPQAFDRWHICGPIPAPEDVDWDRLLNT